MFYNASLTSYHCYRGFQVNVQDLIEFHPLIATPTRGIGLAVTSILLNRFNTTVVTLSRTITSELRDLASDRLLTLECDVFVLNLPFKVKS